MYPTIGHSKAKFNQKSTGSWRGEMKNTCWGKYWGWIYHGRKRDGKTRTNETWKFWTESRREDGHSDMEKDDQQSHRRHYRTGKVGGKQVEGSEIKTNWHWSLITKSSSAMVWRSKVLNCKAMCCWNPIPLKLRIFHLYHTLTQSTQLQMDIETYWRASAMGQCFIQESQCSCMLSYLHHGNYILWKKQLQ